MIVKMETVDKAARDPNMPQFQAILRDVQLSQCVTRQLQYFRVGCGGMTTEQLDPELGVLPVAPTPWRLVAKNRSRVLEAQRQGLLLVMIKVKTTDRSGILWTQAELSMVQPKSIEILPQLLPKTGLKKIATL